MKKLQILGLMLLTVAIFGCVTKSTTVDPSSGKTNIVYSPDSRIQQYTDTAHQALAAGSSLVPTAAPYFTAADGILSAVAAALAGVSGLLAKSKNKHQAAADSLAQTVQTLGQPAVIAALKTAGTNNVSSVVAQHLDNNVPA